MYVDVLVDLVQIYLTDRETIAITKRKQIVVKSGKNTMKKIANRNRSCKISFLPVKYPKTNDSISNLEIQSSDVWISSF